MFQSVYALGLAVWLTIAVIDNLRGFRELVHAVGVTMSMALLRQPPAVHSILSERAVTSIHWHRLAVLLLLALKLVAMAAAWIGCHALLIGGSLAQAAPGCKCGATPASGWVDRRAPIAQSQRLCVCRAFFYGTGHPAATFAGQRHTAPACADAGLRSLRIGAFFFGAVAPRP